MELELISFIKANSDWEKILSEKPYCLSISRDKMFGKNLIMFKYSQIDSDFSNEIVKESRGIILDEDTLEVVCYPFRKFMNYGEPTADPINWNTATISQKIDGSLIKIVRLGDNLLISTNGTIDAFKASVTPQVGCPYNSFGDIVQSLLNSHGDYLKYFKEDITYMFELVSPWTRVVIPYNVPRLYFLGMRGNGSYQEYDASFAPTICKDFPTPEIFSFGTFDDCIANATQLPWDFEGYVVRDADFHRVKVKSPAWIAVHHIKDNGAMSYSRAIELIRTNEVGEVLTYFPELEEEFGKIQLKYTEFVGKSVSVWNEFDKEFSGRIATRKEMALWIQKHFPIPAIGFSMLDRKISSVEDWFKNCNIDYLVKALGFKQ